MALPFGTHFIAQLGTYGYLVIAGTSAPQFAAAQWPQWAIYNLIVANFWPLYWLARFFDPGRLDTLYWRVFEVAASQSERIIALFRALAG